MRRVTPSRFLYAVTAIVLMLASAVAGPALAQRGRWDASPAPYAPRSAAEQRRVSMEQAIENVQRATGGKVLDARDSDGGYRIKVITRRGEVRVVYVDARTGAMR